MIKRSPRRYGPTQVVMAHVQVPYERRRRYRLRNPPAQIVVRQIHHREVRSRPEHIRNVPSDLVPAQIQYANPRSDQGRRDSAGDPVAVEV